MAETLTSPVHTALRTADVDGDGLTDVVSVSYSLDPAGAYLNLFFQDGPGAAAFAPSERLNLGTQASLRPFHVVVADLNLDAQPDVVVSHTGITTSGAGSPGNTLSVLLQDPEALGEFLPKRTYPVGDLPKGLATGDLDQDGLPDIVVATSGGVFQLLQDGAEVGRFQPALAVSAAAAETVDLGDLDGDGLLDLAFDAGNAITLLFNDPGNAGTFIDATTVVQPEHPTDIRIRDLNGDGRLDLSAALVRSSANPDRGGVAVTLQRPAPEGGFLAATEHVIDPAFRVNSVDVHDLNADGRPDIVLAVQGTEASNAKMVVMLQSPGDAASFGTPTAYRHPGINDPWMAVITQLGPDALPDVALANAYDGIYVFLQSADGGGSFGSATNIGK